MILGIQLLVSFKYISSSGSTANEDTHTDIHTALRLNI